MKTNTLPLLQTRLLPVAFTLMLSAPSTLQAQTTAVDRFQDPILQAWRANDQVMACDQCHYAPTPGLVNPDTAFSRQNELRLWLSKDKHAVARFRVEPCTEQELQNKNSQFKLEGEQLYGDSNLLSRQICETLGYDLDDPRDTSFRDNCLTCHGGYRYGNQMDEANFASGQPGVSCNYCHQKGDETDWISEHGVRINRDKWRGMTPNQKESVGMRDLVSTSKRADLCYDCHIGNRKANQFVTHEMYAAGHPPLPSIEVHTFSEQMPRHWRSQSDTAQQLSSMERKEYYRLNFPSLEAPNETYWETREILIGSLAARIKSLELVLDSSELALWTDYSLYDCSACHHELRSNSRRQNRLPTTPPGRPRQTEWTDLRLLQLDRFLPNDSAAIMGLEETLAHSFTARPFGDEELVVRDASRLRMALLAAMVVGETGVVDHATAIATLKGLIDTPMNLLITYDAARQVVWAIQAINGELARRGHPISPAVEKQIKDLSQPLASIDAGGVATRLPAGRSESIYKQGVRNDLLRRSNFDPEKLFARLQSIKRAMP